MWDGEVAGDDGATDDGASCRVADVDGRAARPSQIVVDEEGVSTVLGLVGYQHQLEGVHLATRPQGRQRRVYKLCDPPRQNESDVADCR